MQCLLLGPVTWQTQLELTDITMTNKIEHICILELLVGISICIGSINLPTLYTQIWPAFITWNESVQAEKLQNHLSTYNHILFHNGDFTAACLQCFPYRIHSLCIYCQVLKAKTMLHTNPFPVTEMNSWLHDSNLKFHNTVVTVFFTLKI